jgi:hypothetical protein
MGRSCFYSQAAYIDKYVPSAAATYGSVETWTAATVTTPCLISPNEYSKSQMSDKQSFVAFWDMECAYGVNIAEKDRVRFDSKTFDVISVFDPLKKGACLKIKLRVKE